MVSWMVFGEKWDAIPPFVNRHKTIIIVVIIIGNCQSYLDNIQINIRKFDEKKIPTKKYSQMLFTWIL